MSKREDITNKKYGKLTCLYFVHNSNRSKWLCLCECGNFTIVDTNKLKSGHTTSCGCKKKIYIKYPKRLLQTYRDMKHRCYSGKHIHYNSYQGKGIVICKEWLTDKTKFFDWAMSNGYQDNLTIDRIDVNGNYEPSNCRWVDSYVQMNNTTRNHYLYINGKKLTIAQASRKYNISEYIIQQRINKLGWDDEKAVFTPVRRMCYNHNRK